MTSPKKTIGIPTIRSSEFFKPLPILQFTDERGRNRHSDWLWDLYKADGYPGSWENFLKRKGMTE